MHITVYCPGCGSRYQLKPETRGQQIRCPNPICRRTFKVHEAESPPADGAARRPDPAVPAAGSYVTGPVGEIVPMLPAETANDPGSAALAAAQPQGGSPAHVQDFVPLLPATVVGKVEPAPASAEARTPPSPPPNPAPSKTSSWQDQPPPVRKREKARADPPPPLSGQAALRQPPSANDRPSKPRVAADTMPAAREAPRELPPGTWEQPPVRRGAGDASPKSAPSEPAMPAAPSEAEAMPSQGKRRRARWLMAGLLMLLASGLIGGVVWYAVNKIGYEDRLYTQAKADFAGGKYSDSAKNYRKLESAFPDSDRAQEYQFFAELSEVNVEAYDIRPKPAEALEKLRQFINDHKNDPLSKQNQQQVWRTMRKLTEDLATLARQTLESSSDLEKARQAHGQAEQALTDLRNLAPRDINPSEFKEIRDRLEKVNDAIRHVAKRDLFLADLKKEAATPVNIERWEDKAGREGLGNDARVRELLDRLRSRMQEAVRYVPAPANTAGTPAAESAPSLLVVPPLPKPAAGQSTGGVIFALARGVLYALAEPTGQVLWATRVGIDTATLPVRVRVNAIAPEIALVLSSDTNTLTARDALTGKPVWHHDLHAPCLGRPALVEQRVYVPTYDGRVHEIELISGQRLGWYQLGLPLTTGGARQEGTKLLYIPAERRYVYVLDVDEGRRQRPCVAILQSKHPSGSLRGEPIMASWDGLPAGMGSPPRFLILSQTDGLGSMKLRTFRLPIEGPQAGPVQPEVRVRGWSWFPPHADAEKIAFVTDAGVLGLFGINQPHNQDRPLFPLLAKECILEATNAPPGRAQVAHAGERDFWVLAHGELQHLQLGIDQREGLKISKLWPEPVHLGSPLHAGQVNEALDTLFVVTQLPDRQTCVATAVEAATGKIRWQRQLGLLCQAEPLLVGDKVVALDRGAGLFQFDPSQLPHQPGVEWQTGGQLLVEPVPGPLSSPPLLIAAADGKSVYAITCLADGSRLIVRRYPGSKKGPVEQEFALPAALAGTLALGTDCLVLPLAGGNLRRQSLAGELQADGGPNWRSPRADADAPGHVVHLGGDDFLATDGSRGLIHLHWPADKVWAMKKLADLPIRRIVAAPVVMPPDPDIAGPRVCFADSEGTVILLQGKDLQETRRWPLAGPITAGPFVRGRHIGCVVDRRQLVWIDPAKEQPVWKFATKGEAIVGQPQRIGDGIVVADLSGRFVGLDPATGQARGPGYTLKASVVPAVAPVAFGSDRVFAPLSDGTVLLLPLRHLH